MGGEVEVREGRWEYGEGEEWGGRMGWEGGREGEEWDGWEGPEVEVREGRWGMDGSGWR